MIISKDCLKKENAKKRAFFESMIISKDCYGKNHTRKGWKEMTLSLSPQASSLSPSSSSFFWSTMKTRIGKTLLLTLLFLLASATNGADFFTDCPITRCRKGGPEIRYPFKRVDLPGQAPGSTPAKCGLPGFELTCNTTDNQVKLSLPYAGDFYVQSIDYVSQNLLVTTDPQGCLLRRLPLNLSSSNPFRRDSSRATNVTLFNCGSTNSSSMEAMGYSDRFLPVNCLSKPGAYIYAVESDEWLGEEPPSCQRLDTTTSLDSSRTFTGPLFFTTTLVLVWDLPSCRSCETNGLMCGLNSTNVAACLLPPHKDGLTPPAIVGIFAAVIFSAILAMSFYYWDHKFRGDWEVNRFEVEKFLESYESLNPKRFSYSDVKKMTNQFQQKLGQGGFGSVYKGRLPNGIPVAVKTIEMYKSEGDEFINEVATIGRVHHVNVVRLLGFCAERFKRALVYEFMPNGSLEKFIFSTGSKPCELGWDKLQEIALGIARGIEYLHQGCDQRILHFDIKPHNVLLDHNFTPKISDFGLAKFCSKDQSIISMAEARGTVGYIAPEVVSRNFGNVSYKSDVYSFGMLLLEMVGKRKNIDVDVENASQVYFPEWIYNHIDVHGDLGIGVNSQEEDEIARKLSIVALWCIQLNPVDRPNMKRVVQMLEAGATEILEIPPKPFVPRTA